MANANIRNDNQYTYISSATETAVDTGQGSLVAIVVTETAAGAITIADAVSGTTPAIAVLKASIAEGTYTFNVRYKTGLVITTAGASKLTVISTPSN